MKLINRNQLALFEEVFLKKRKERNDKITLLEDYIYFLSLKYKKIPQFPVVVILHLTDRCNLNCVHCYKKYVAKWVPKSEELSLKEYKKLIEELANYGIVRVVLTGGEPFLREDLVEIISCIKKNGLIYALTTNGTIIDEKVLEQISTVSSKYDSIQISIDTLKKGNIRPVNIETIRQNINMMRDYSIPIVANMTLTSLNYNEMLDVYMFCEEMGIKNLIYSPFFVTSQNKALFICDIEDFIKKHYEVLVYAKSKGYPVKILQDGFGVATPFWQMIKTQINPSIDIPTFICRAGINYCDISPNGSVFPCPFLEFPEFIIGNIREKSLYELWNRSSSRWNVLRKKVLYTNKTGQCKLATKCRKGCSAQSYHIYGKIEKCDPRCIFIHDSPLWRNCYEDKG